MHYQAIDDLRQSSLFAALDNSVMVAVSDRSGTILEVNEAMCRISGYSRAELVGTSVSRISRGADCGDFWAELWPVVSGGGTWRGELNSERKDGSIYWVDATASPLRGPSGSIIGSVCVRVDITERKRAEAALRASEARLLHAQRMAQLGDWELDVASGELTWSDTVYEIFEIDPQRFGASYAAFLALVHPEDRELVDGTYHRSVESRVSYDLVHRLLMPDGRIKHVHERCETVYDIDGLPLRSIGTVQDISDRTRTEAQIAKASRREALATLAGGIAHEFNSTLLAAGTYLYGAEAESGAAAASIRKAAALIQQGQSLSASLLELFAGPEQAEIPRLVVATWLPECIGRLSEIVPQTRVSLAPIPESMPVWADPLSLEQVLRILLTNAADALEGDGEVRVSTSPRSKAGAARDLVEIRVTDNGPGIPSVHRDHIFEPFFTTRDRSRRSGLGLAIASRLMEHAGGSLSYEPAVPRGSTFVIRLRTARQEEAA